MLPPPPHNKVLLELDFNVQRKISFDTLLFLSDLKSTNQSLLYFFSLCVVCGEGGAFKKIFFSSFCC